MIIIYKYTNTINNKVYIGQTCQSITDRAGKNGYRYKHCWHFYNAICKYGWDTFSVEILEELPNQKDADAKEKYYISKYNSIDNGYNLDLGGHIEKSRSIETKNKISKSVSSNKNGRAKEVIKDGNPTGLTIGEYAKQINVSQSTLKNWCKTCKKGYSYRSFNTESVSTIPDECKGVDLEISTKSKQ